MRLIMGRCITRTRDFDSFCDKYKEAIEEEAQDRYDQKMEYYKSKEYFDKIWLEVASEMWDDAEDVDPLGGDSDED
jgi:hypothetical protein